MLQVIPIGFGEKIKPINLEVDSIQQIFAAIQIYYGVEFFREFGEESIKHIIKVRDKEEFIALEPGLLELDLKDFDTYFLVSEFEGEISAAIVAAALAYVGATAAASSTIAVAAITLVLNAAISFAISAIVQAISPTPQFNSDPAQAQTKVSSLFNGAINVNNQGGGVPLIFGNPFVGGVVVSSGIFTEER